MADPSRLGLWLRIAARVVVAAVFVAAAVPKILDPVGFADDIRNYQAFPLAWVNVMAAVIPALELVGAASILTGWKRRGGAVVLGALTLGFIVLIASVIVRGIDIECGCFGRDPDAGAVGWSLLARDVGLLALVVLSVWPHRRT